ncbi:hypothetical protein CPC08DRAFT_769108 [Agrocybe pediades]|nr:hypothetical protein CPC08DRAFT_769108 [Agrocybe pediades]
MSDTNHESLIASRSHDGEDKSGTLSRIKGLLQEAITVAKSIELNSLGSKDGQSVNEVHILTHSLLQALPCDASNATKYEEHEAALKKDVDTLYAFCDANRYSKVGYIDENNMIAAILSKIGKWIKQIWLLMQNEYTDINVVEKAVVLCSETVQRIRRSGTQVEYEDMEHRIKIVNAKGKKVFKQDGSIGDTLAWMWRELLVLSASRNLPTQSIMTNIQRFRLVNGVFEIMPEPCDWDDSEEEDEDEDGEWGWDGENLWYKHWSEEMRVAAEQVRASLSR